MGLEAPRRPPRTSATRRAASHRWRPRGSRSRAKDAAASVAPRQKALGLGEHLGMAAAVVVADHAEHAAHAGVARGAATASRPFGARVPASHHRGEAAAQRFERRQLGAQVQAVRHRGCDFQRHPDAAEDLRRLAEGQRLAEALRQMVVRIDEAGHQQPLRQRRSASGAGGAAPPRPAGRCRRSGRRAPARRARASALRAAASIPARAAVGVGRAGLSAICGSCIDRVSISVTDSSGRRPRAPAPPPAQPRHRHAPRHPAPGGPADRARRTPTAQPSARSSRPAAKFTAVAASATGSWMRCAASTPRLAGQPSSASSGSSTTGPPVPDHADRQPTARPSSASAERRQRRGAVARAAEQRTEPRRHRQQPDRPAHAARPATRPASVRRRRAGRARAVERRGSRQPAARGRATSRRAGEREPEAGGGHRLARRSRRPASSAPAPPARRRCWWRRSPAGQQHQQRGASDQHVIRP